MKKFSIFFTSVLHEYLNSLNTRLSKVFPYSNMPPCYFYCIEITVLLHFTYITNTR